MANFCDKCCDECLTCTNNTTVRNAVFRRISDNTFVLDINIKIQTCSSVSATGLMTLDSVTGELTADPSITIENLRFGNSTGCDGVNDGCEPGTFSVLITPDKKEFTIIFGSFVVQSNGNIAKEICSEKSCRLRITFKGENLKCNEEIILTTTYNGVNSITLGSWSSLIIDYQSVSKCNGPIANNYINKVIQKGVVSDNKVCNCCGH